MMKEETVTPFQRCHFEPCASTHFIDGQVDVNGAPQRIACVVYVDAGRTWDNILQRVCDGFYMRLQERFSLTFGGGAEFIIGMDISLGEGWLKITSSTYIMNMCQRWLDYPVEKYDHVSTPAHPKLMELYDDSVHHSRQHATGAGHTLQVSRRWPHISSADYGIDCLFAVG